MATRDKWGIPEQVGGGIMHKCCVGVSCVPRTQYDSDIGPRQIAYGPFRFDEWTSRSGGRQDCQSSAPQCAAAKPCPSEGDKAGGEARGVEAPPLLLCVVAWCEKLKASWDESYCLVGVGVLLGELDAFVACAKNGKPFGDAAPLSGIYVGRLYSGSSLGVARGDVKKQNLFSCK